MITKTMNDNVINSIKELLEMIKQYAINIYDDSQAKMEIIINSMFNDSYWKIETLIEDNVKIIGFVLCSLICVIGTWSVNRNYPKEIRDKPKEYIVPVIGIGFTFLFICMTEEEPSLKHIHSVFELLRYIRL